MRRRSERPHCSRCDYHTPAFLKTPDRKFFVIDVRDLPAVKAAAAIRDGLEQLETPARRIA